jgi:hypothetical protein
MLAAMDEPPLKRAALITVRGATFERFPPGTERQAWRRAARSAASSRTRAQAYHDPSTGGTHDASGNRIPEISALVSRAAAAWGWGTHDIESFESREGFAVKSWHQDIQTGAGADALLLRPGPAALSKSAAWHVPS